MNGNKLNSGLYIKDKLTNDEIWDTFDWLFSTKSHNTSSYKFIFLKSLLDCIDKIDDSGRLSFDDVFYRFTEISWNLVLKYKIPQSGKVSDGRITLLEKTLHSFIESNEGDMGFSDLNDLEKREICNLIKRCCKKYVVGALYGDMRGYIYSFSKSEEWIIMNPQMIKFINNNKDIIYNLNFYKWAAYYESICKNVNSDYLFDMIDVSFIRKGESIYRTVLAYEFERNILVKNETNRKNDNLRINTLELLFEAESLEEKHLDYLSEIPEEVELEDEMYKDMEHMKEYLSDPIILLKQIKKNRVS